MWNDLSWEGTLHNERCAIYALKQSIQNIK